MRRKKQGKRVFGMGAPVKGNTLLNYCGIGRNYLDCLVEKNPLRRGLYSPGMHLPIVMEDELDEQPDVYYVLAWNFKKEILANNRALLDAGRGVLFPRRCRSRVNMDILVTGATGFLGTGLCSHLESLGHRVVRLGSRNCDLTQPDCAASVRRSPL